LLIFSSLQLQEAEFWKRYFQSKLFNAHRASIRSAATQHVVRDDPIFDRYLEKDDDELEPRRVREERVDLFIDLYATNEDHGETGNIPDLTMQAGKQRATLPLIRKFNEHSERLLKASLGDEPSAKRRRTDSGVVENRMSQLDLDDLHDPLSQDGVALQMQDRQRYFDGQARSNAASVQASVNASTARVGAATAVRSALAGLVQYKPDQKPGNAALSAMTQAIGARLEARARRDEFPQTLLQQMMTCETAATEFLRQFWLSVYPPPGAPPQTPAVVAQRAQRAAKMINFLARTPEKVDALIRAAQSEDFDYTRVEAAMKPMLDAVQHAMQFHQSRQTAAGVRR
jgi:transcription initiation factor TFIIH subunit 1